MKSKRNKAIEEENHEESEFSQDLVNLDNLPESAALYSNTEMTRAQEIMGEAVEHLQGRQKEVYILMMRCGKSHEEAAEILRISKSAAQIYLNRARKFLTGYCRTVAKKEGLL